jgi:sec-independent protein translocase protein TatA
MGFPLLFDISGGELIVILLFVLLFFGAKGIPDIARTMGRTLRQVRDASNEVQREINKGAHEVRRSMEDQRRAFNAEPPAAPTLPAPQPEAPSAPATSEPPVGKEG